jgi:orotidine 5'-phosphate decarboxylase subfamily 2
VTGFASRLKRCIAEHGPLCLGIDPSATTLAACGLPDSAQGAFEFGCLLLELAAYRLALVKPQVAFFERFGSAGWRALEEVTARARREGVLVLLDAKRGDIGSTVEAYAEAYFSPSGPLRADAMTVHPYLGFGALRPLLDFAVAHEGGVFVVVRSSNPEGLLLQTARLTNGSSVAQELCQAITAYNRLCAGERIGPVGSVVGATCEDAGETVAALPRSYVLAPGVGAQGASFDDIARRMHCASGRVIPAVSRAILANGSTPQEIRSAIRHLQERARNCLGG